MVDRETMDRRLAKLEGCLRELRRVATTPEGTYVRDTALQAQAERWLHLAAECCIDVAHHLIADRGWRTPTTYRAAFEVLAEEGVLDRELAGKMGAWAGLRNILVHLYLEVDHALVHGILSNDLDELEEFAAAVSRSLGDPTR